MFGEGAYPGVCVCVCECVCMFMCVRACVCAYSVCVFGCVEVIKFDFYFTIYGVSNAVL